MRPIDGLIPAHAGKTPLMRTAASMRAAHPRSRGENLRFGGLFPPDDGSSPLTRGKLIRHGGLALGYRLIPAHAGKTRVVQVSAALLEAHPRSRGENAGQAPPQPHAPGLIPAHAGKTGPAGPRSP